MTRGVVDPGFDRARSAPRRSTSSRRHRDEYQVVALAAGRNAELLAEQARASASPAELARSCADDPEALAELAAHPDADVVLNAVVGFAGLPATIAAPRGAASGSRSPTRRA